MKELWNKLDKMAKIQVGGGAGVAVLGVFTLFTPQWPMGVALLAVSGFIVYQNVKKHL